MPGKDNIRNGRKTASLSSFDAGGQTTRLGVLDGELEKEKRVWPKVLGVALAFAILFTLMMLPVMLSPFMPDGSKTTPSSTQGNSTQQIQANN